MNFFSKNQLNYALIMCLIVVVCLGAMQITGNNKSFEHSPLVAIFTFVAPAVIWFLAIREKKKKLNGKMTFKQGFVEGFKLSLLYAIISPVIFLIYYLFVNPPIVEYVKHVYQLENASNATVIGVDIGFQVLGSIIGFTLYGALVSLFLRSKNKS